MTYYCIYDGYSHRERSSIGWEHSPLKVDEEELDPFRVSTGISIVIPGTKLNEASRDDVLGFWDVENFNNQFDEDPIDQIREWIRIHLVGRTRHSGKEWYSLLSNERASKRQPMSPDRFSLLMRKYAKAYGRIANIEVPQGFNI